MITLARALRRAADDDRGISIVEVMVAITLLAVTMAATASNVVRSLQVASDSRNTVLAANIAQFELERLRSIPFVDWASSLGDTEGTDTLTTTFTGTGPNGIVYEVYREARWVSSDVETDGCAAFGDAGADADYIRVRQVVTFPGDPDLSPVENITVITPRLDDSDAFSGNLAVIVRDRDGLGARDHIVRIQGSAGIELQRTDTTGCAFFALLPVNPDNPLDNAYDITIDTDGYVDRVLKTQLVTETVIVRAQSTTVMEFEYDKAVTYDFNPRPSAAPFGTCELVPVYIPAATNADDVTARAEDPEAPPYVPDQRAWECHTTSGVAVSTTGVPGGSPVWRATVPSNLGYSVYNPATDWSVNGRLTTYPSLVQTAIPDTQTRGEGEVCSLYDPDTGECLSRVLFPYPSGYEVHAGRCPASDPVVAFGASRQRLDSEPGTRYQMTDAIDVRMALVTVRSAQSNPQPYQAARDVYADMQDDADCADGERLYLGRTDANGELRVLMPYGRWVFHWDNQGNGSMRLDDQTTLPTPASCDDSPGHCVTINPDGTVGFSTVDRQPGDGVIDVERGDRVG